VPRVLVWGRWRGVAGAVAQVERQAAGGWTPAGSPLAVAAPSAAVQATLPWQGGVPARIHWSAPGGAAADSPAVAPQSCGQQARAARHPQKWGPRHRKVGRRSRARRPIRAA
jgi:hypothetical protein